MSRAGDVNENPITGERVVVRVGTEDSGEALLVCDVYVRPGGLHERFLEEIGEEAQDLTNPPVTEGPPDIEGVARIAAKYGTEFPPSPA